MLNISSIQQVSNHWGKNLVFPTCDEPSFKANNISIENQPKHWDFSSTTIVFKSVAQSVLASAVSLCFEIYLADFFVVVYYYQRGVVRGWLGITILFFI